MKSRSKIVAHCQILRRSKGRYPAGSPFIVDGKFVSYATLARKAQENEKK